MVSNTKPLFSLTAADLMSAPVIKIPEEMSLKGAAHRLAEAAVTGAPVINCHGRCIGVLSATDYVHWMDREHRALSACAAAPSFHASWEMFDAEQLPNQSVRDYMTRDPVTARASATIGKLARNMVNAHIHRIVVVDEFDKPLGIVSSTDLLAALAEAEQQNTAS